MRRAGKTDNTQTESVLAFLYHGCSVRRLSSMGDGWPDLVVGLLGVTHLVEAKSFPAGTVKGDLRESQKEWLAGWQGDHSIVRGAADVKKLVAKWVREAKKEWMRDVNPGV